MKSERRVIYQDEKSRISEWTGEFADLSHALAELDRLGCGAWVGTEACGATVDKDLIIGGSQVLFRSYRAASVPGLGNVVAVCPRHAGADLARDMDLDLFFRQEQERLKFIALHEAHTHEA